jgi:hypothetical protein
MGWGIITKRKFGNPQLRAMARPVAWNTSVMMDAEGMPCCSNTILSSTLPELHDPQSPTPAMMISQAPLYSSMISA